ncbi:MAG: hypothetical protein F2681_02540 [Actinobacteria bacterium]|uniref:Unannotated protein n=1 Tax=freshwater metagenome TaxID=449393 RepID=A0A6J6QBB4_9ZZZZ|nr:hypothetical protein [Actinomycetota bacterium]MSW76291.1 hypothetical protein [Actinomycetota bacterium]MSX94277.1 hypothetical protein [Actinomycetota bacterium]MSZ82001.1 hypothetical protein [Actinomycetota bacterium]MTB16840.1 hypothetical protein [Actinomycetota bacterium]
MRSATLHVTEVGITRASRRSRTLAAASIRRIYLYTDANGDECLVARGPGLRLQFVSLRELADPAIRQGVMALVAAVAGTADVDAVVTTYLASLAA